MRLYSFIIGLAYVKIYYLDFQQWLDVILCYILYIVFPVLAITISLHVKEKGFNGTANKLLYKRHREMR